MALRSLGVCVSAELRLHTLLLGSSWLKKGSSNQGLKFQHLWTPCGESVHCLNKGGSRTAQTLGLCAICDGSACWKNTFVLLLWALWKSRILDSVVKRWQLLCLQWLTVDCAKQQNITHLSETLTFEQQRNQEWVCLVTYISTCAVSLNQTLKAKDKVIWCLFRHDWDKKWTNCLETESLWVLLSVWVASSNSAAQ